MRSERGNPAQLAAHKVTDRTDSPEREHEAGAAAAGSEQDSLRKLNERKSRSASTKGEMQRKVAAPRDRARKHERGDVHARDDEDAQGDRAERQRESRLGSVRPHQ